MLHDHLHPQTLPLQPSGVEPDRAMLRLTRESELQKGGMIGAGAFGTVYNVFFINIILVIYICSPKKADSIKLNLKKDKITKKNGKYKCHYRVTMLQLTKVFGIV